MTTPQYYCRDVDHAALFLEGFDALKARSRDAERAGRQRADDAALHARDTKAGDTMNAQEMMTRARRALRREIPDIESLEAFAGDKPESFEKPKFGTPDYWLAHRVGWISEQEVAADKALFDKRRRTSLQTCHRYAMRGQFSPYRDTDHTYVPEMSARIFNDPALTDGARRCAAKLIELIYRRNRRYRNLGITVGYLAQCLDRAERTVQNYLRLLRQRGYIEHQVVITKKTKMCSGIFIQLLKPIFPRHHANAWPNIKENPGVNPDSEKYLFYSIFIYKQDRVGVDSWTYRCMDGVYRAFERYQPRLLMEKSRPCLA